MRSPAFFEQREEVIRPALEVLEAEHFKLLGLSALGGDVALARQQAVAAYLDPTQRFITMLSYAVKVASVLGLMCWQILRFDAPVLAYSDHPVVLWPLNVPFSEPFERQGPGPLEALEIRVPIAPDAAIVMNWLDLSYEVGISEEMASRVQHCLLVVGRIDQPRCCSCREKVHASRPAWGWVVWAQAVELAVWSVPWRQFYAVDAMAMIQRITSTVSVPLAIWKKIASCSRPARFSM